MRWLIDSDTLIEGERGNPLFEAWSRSEGEFATADVIRTEFLLGVHAVADSVKRRRGERFYAERIAGIVSLSNQPQDYEAAARLAGEARRRGKRRAERGGRVAGGHRDSHRCDRCHTERSGL